MMLTHLDKKLVTLDATRCTHPYELRQHTHAFIVGKREGEQIGGFYCAGCGTYVAYDGIYVDEAPVIFGGSE